MIQPPNTVDVYATLITDITTMMNITVRSFIKIVINVRFTKGFIFMEIISILLEPSKYIALVQYFRRYNHVTNAAYGLMSEQDCCVKVYVFPSGELLIEPGSKFQERRDPTI